MRVLIPRGGSWGDEVARLVAAAGFEPVVRPLVRTVPAEDQDALGRELARLADGGFDWLVVTSRSTVPVLPPVPGSVRVAAVGAATAAALRERGVPVDFVPARQSAAGLVAEWPVREGSAFWPRALDARPTVAEGLRRHGMRVTDVVAYRTVPVDAPALERGEPPIDAALVTSGSIARQVARLGLPAGARVIAIGEQTAEDCRALGLPVAGVAAQPSPAALVEALRASASEGA
ncbi:uroporphyrinogen-III synthase [Agrococcus lahaulensis]|uniref:uroporphyrinogen-III synthase n=1 Tax=Agrococcus lahaulensis TaxID=341722 RepID=UPI000557ED77|nr:uroporphyrinogen-III synthase [Agrococcus lahaulensis]